MTSAADIPVLIVGGGLAGLSTAVFLSHRGISCLLVERSPGLSDHPRFRGLTVRSMELYRSVGLAERIQAVGTPGGDIGGIARVKNLAHPGAVWEKTAWEDDTARLSPVDACSCDQNRLEPILAEYAERHRAVLRFGTELIGLDQDSDGVMALLRERASGAEHTVRARYVVAADGSGSLVRQLLGIGRDGPGVLGHQVSIVFEADIEPELDGRRFGACYVEDVSGALLPRDGGLWQVSVSYSPDKGERPEDFTDDRCLELIEAALGRAEPSARVRVAGPWDVAAAVATRFQEGRVFLVGDAAHVMPPSGGFGGNTGIQDAHNLAWKLAEVLEGTAGPALLDTYDEERRPVAELTLIQSLARMPLSWLGGDSEAPPLPPQIPHNTVSLGYLYRSAAVAEEDGADEVAVEDPRTPSGRPGSRAPHLVIEADGVRKSSLDLLGSGLTLLTGTGTTAWTAAVAQVAARHPGLRLTEWRIGPDGDARDVEGRWPGAYGVGPDGAVLVRPDGFVSWRARTLPDTPVEALAAAAASCVSADSKPLMA
ncbi:FAD-dependent oxidoreductase [Nonomuraea polychroma]|uniref:FAD-dependent oxidoreductase n=1 Tax=Nonomuraea polychroma TaxID=46176 RepID=UPI003D939FEC